MRTTAKVDYAVRASVELARHSSVVGERPTPVTRQVLAEAQGIPPKFLEHILADLRRAQLVASVRGTDGGYWLCKTPEDVSVADIIRAVEGPLADVRGERPEFIEYPANMATLQRMWVALRTSLRSVLEQVTLADLRDGTLPPEVDALANVADAWVSR